MGYITLKDGNSFSEPSYTIRSFMPDTMYKKVVPNDVAYHGTAYGIGTANIGGSALIRSFVQEGWRGAIGVTQTFLSGTSNPALDPGTPYPAAYSQETMDNYSQIGLGRLEDAGIPVYGNADGFYNYGIDIEILPGSVSNKPYNLESSFDDDFTIDFLSGQGPFYIQMPLWDWPGTGIVSGSVTFSSSTIYAPADTVSIPFDAPVVGQGLGVVGDLSSAGDKIWRIDRSVLTDGNPTYGGSVDISNVKRIKITLNPTTQQYPFKTGPMKIVDSNYNYYKANVDTKRGHLIMERWPDFAQDNFPAVIQDGLKVKNFVYVSKFFVGANLPEPTTGVGVAESSIVQQDESYIVGAADSHEMALFSRVHPNRISQPDLYLSTRIILDNEKTELAIYEGQTRKAYFYKYGTIPTGEYFLIFDCKNEKVNASIWRANGNSLESLFLETGFQPIENSWLSGAGSAIEGYDAGYGYAGYEFKPQSGDFYLDYVYSKDVVLAEYESKSFLSNLPVESVTLFSTSIPDTELLKEGIYGLTKVRTADNFFLGKNEVGDLDTDVVLTSDVNTVFNTESLKVTKTGNAYIASVENASYITIPNFSRLVLKMKLRYDNALNNGKFKVVFWDRRRMHIAYVQELTGIVANQWNEVEIPLISNAIYNDELVFEFGYFGNDAGSYWIEDISLTTESVEWETSNNDGLTYLPFLTAINGQYKSVNFPSNDFYSIVIRDRPKTFFTFDNIEDVGAYEGTGSANITNHYPYSANNGKIVATAGTNSFAFPVAMPQSLQTWGPNYDITSGTSYYLPAGVRTQKEDYLVALYKDSQIVSDPYSAPFSGTAITYSTWFYTDDINNNHLLVQHGTASPDWSFNLLSAASASSGTTSIEFIGSTGTKEVSIPQWNDGKWHQASFTFDDAYLRIYYDGELIAYENKDNIGAFPASITGPFLTTGPNSGSTPYPYIKPTVDSLGIIDTNQPFIAYNAIIVYDKVLPASKIKDQYITSISEYNQLRIRARAYTANAWVSGYEVVPRYARLGRIVPSLPDTTSIVFDKATFDNYKFGI